MFPSEDFVTSVPLVTRKPTFLPLSGDCLRCFPPSLDEELEVDSMPGRTLLPKALWTVTRTLWKLHFPKLSTCDQGSPGTLPLLNRASRSLKVPREASVVHTATEFTTLARYDCAGIITSKRRLRGSLQSRPGNLTAGSSGNLEVNRTDVCPSSTRAFP